MMMKGGFFFSNRVHPSDLVAGDHIYSYRKSWGYLFPHHGLFVSSNKVVHFMGDTSFMLVVSRSEISPYCEVCRFHGSLTGVVTSCLKCFLKGGTLRRFRYGVGWWDRVTSVRGVCSMTRSDALDVVLERASFFENRKTFGVYDVMENNCMHFVYYCKTGRILKDVNDGRGQEVKVVEVEGSIVKMVRERSLAWVLANAVASLLSCLLLDPPPPHHHLHHQADVTLMVGDHLLYVEAPANALIRCSNHGGGDASSSMWALSLLKGFTRPLLLSGHSHAS